MKTNLHLVPPNLHLSRIVSLKTWAFFFALVFTVVITKSQVVVTGGTGAVTGSPFTKLSDAIAAINVGGALTAPVFVNVPAGFTESLTGKITLTMTGTVANPIVIQKSGSGTNPLLTSYTGLIATPSNAADGMFVLAGCDYVTIDGIDLQEKSTNTTTTTVMEFGYGLFKASATDGCQNNTIKNCTITLNRIQNGTWTAPGHNGSVGIAMNNGLNTASGVLTVTAASGTNSFNKFYANTIQNCNAGIAIVGFAALTPFTLGDTGNDVGGSSAVTGNTILNYGGGAVTNPATGIFANQQWGFNCSFNTINNNNGSGINHATTLRGIFLNSSSASASVTCNNNIVTVKSGATTSQLTGIDVEFGSTPAGNTVDVNNNTVQNSTYAGATTGTFQCILTSTSAANVNVNGNTINNNSMTGTGQFDCIVIQSTPTNVTASNNTVTNNSKAGTGTMNCMYTSSTVTNVNMNTNTISGNTIAGGAATTTLFCLRNSLCTYSINGNTITNNGITAMSAINTGEVDGYSNVNSSTSETFTNNIITNLTIGGTSTSTAHLIRGLVVTSNASSIKNFNGNTISGLSYTGTSGSATVSGIQTSAGATINCNKNKIYNLSSTGAGAIINGLNLVSGTTQNCSNNIIGDLRATDATGLNAINGINATGTSNYLLYYNTINLNATSTSVTTFGNSCLTFSSTSTLGVFRNNNLVNNSTPAQNSSNTASNGIAACIRRSTGTSGVVPTNYNSLSNNNNIWCNATAGTNNHLSYVEGTSTISNPMNTVANLKAFITSSEQASVQENPTFLSTVGTSAQYLHIDPTVPTLLESTAANINTFTTDYDGHIRFGNAGYPGGTAGFPTGGTAPDIGADEFAGILLDITPPSITYTSLSNTCLLSNRTFTATISDVSGVPTTGTLMPRIYFRKNSGAWFSSAGSLSSGTATNGVWSFSINYSLLGGATTLDNIQYYIVAQDVSSSSNISSNPSSGLIATNVNTVTNAPTTPKSYTITALPSFSSFTVSNITCNGNGNGQIVISSTASSPVFSIQPSVTQSPVGTFSSLTAQTYTLTVSDASSCSSTSVASISEPAALLVSATSSSTPCVGTSMSAAVSGGTGAYTYQWISGYLSGNEINIEPSKDNTISNGITTNSNALGTQFLVGQTGGSSRRALLAFDIASSIPTGSQITDVILSLNCSGTASITTPQPIYLHTLLQNWGEGTSQAIGNTGIGNLVPATTNDATWIHTFYPSLPWSTPGGAYAATASASTIVNTIGTYTWTSSSMVSDAQNWLNNPSSNYGWLIKGDESGIHQAKRFSSREEPVSTLRPVLTITYGTPIVASTLSSVSNIAAGTYTLVVTDANGCSNSTVVTVAPSAPALNASASASPILCNGGTSTLTATVTGGGSGYSYYWINGSTSNSVVVNASKDNTIYESNSANSNGQGTQILAGTNGAGFKNRALMSFDLTSSIPGGSIITNASLHLNCTGSSGAAGIQNQSIFRLTEDWGEGTSNALGGVGIGVAATTNDATWSHKFYPTSFWTNPGGTFMSTASATTAINNAGAYSWSNPNMITDIQTWVNAPATNYGWILKGSETGSFQAKKFSSREDTNPSNVPQLFIDYEEPMIVGTGSTLTNITAGTYTLLVVDANGCSATSIVTVTEPAAVIVNANASPSTSICTGSSVTLTASGNATSYAWSGSVANGISFIPASTTTYTVTGTDASGCTANSMITITVTNCQATLDVKFFIQGYYVGSSMMSQVLYNEGVESNATSTQVDTVTVELHDINSPYAMVQSTTGILKTDGHLVCSFPASTISNAYYLVLKHRNALQTWSASSVTMTSTTSYDFSTAATQAYGSNQIEMEPNVWALYTGDINNDESIDASDAVDIDNGSNNSVFGYVTADLNGDGSVDGSDYPVCDLNSTNSIYSIHP